jgi:hypothetical protein
VIEAAEAVMDWHQRDLVLADGGSITDAAAGLLGCRRWL